MITSTGPGVIVAPSANEGDGLAIAYEQETQCLHVFIKDAEGAVLAFYTVEREAFIELIKSVFDGFKEFDS